MDSLWEKMRLEERRVRAAQLGVKVSDLEEMELLQETIDQSREVINQPNTTNIVNNLAKDGNVINNFTDSNKLQNVEIEVDDDAGYFDQNSVLFRKIKPHNSISTISEESNINIETEGGPWHKLPHEVVNRILMILGDIDMIGYLCITSKNTFKPSEIVYKFLCSITYPVQTIHKKLQVENWLNWRNMLIYRPRLRTNGFYTLRTKYSKGYCNDAFWEEKQYKSVEVKFYRHFRFFDHGRVLYSLDIAEPVEMASLLSSGLPITKRIYEGKYTFMKREVIVEVQLHYSHMRFIMELLDGDDGYIGKYNMLRLHSHSAIPIRTTTTGPTTQQLQQQQQQNIQPIHINNMDGNRRIDYPLPIVSDLRFHRFWSFSSRQHSKK